MLQILHFVLPEDYILNGFAGRNKTDFPFYVECIASDQTGSEQADCNADRPFHPAFSGKYMEPFI